MGQDQNVKENCIMIVLVKIRTSCHWAEARLGWWDEMWRSGVLAGPHLFGREDWTMWPQNDLELPASMGVWRMSYGVEIIIISLCKGLDRGRVNHSLASTNRGVMVCSDCSTGRAGECVSISSLLRGRGCLRNRCEHFGFCGWYFPIVKKSDSQGPHRLMKKSPWRGSSE